MGNIHIIFILHNSDLALGIIEQYNKKNEIRRNHWPHYDNENKVMICCNFSFTFIVKIYTINCRLVSNRLWGRKPVFSSKHWTKKQKPAKLIETNDLCKVCWVRKMSAFILWDEKYDFLARDLMFTAKIYC